jgi:hypothetical protein
MALCKIGFILDQYAEHWNYRQLLVKISQVHYEEYVTWFRR